MVGTECVAFRVREEPRERLKHKYPNAIYTDEMTPDFISSWLQKWRSCTTDLPKMGTQNPASNTSLPYGICQSAFNGSLYPYQVRTELKNSSSRRLEQCVCHEWSRKSTIHKTKNEQLQ